jgi:hypothetical protein
VVGVTLFRGGNDKHPSHVVGGYDEASSNWVMKVAVEGTNGPSDGTWGDYLCCRSAGTTWLAAGYTLQGGTTIANVQPDVVEFALV